jgi:hypothetical protein
MKAGFFDTEALIASLYRDWNRRVEKLEAGNARR